MPNLVEKVKGEIVFPLEAVLKLEFLKAEEAQDSYRKTLESGRKTDAAATQQVQKTMDQLIDRLSRVMDAMGDVTTINKLITQLCARSRSHSRNPSPTSSRSCRKNNAKRSRPSWTNSTSSTNDGRQWVRSPAERLQL